MLTPPSLKNKLYILALLLLCQLPVSAQTTPTYSTTSATPEVDFTSSYAVPLANQANQLNNAVAIYQYVYNNFIFETYHGSRSGSVNTFLGLHGSDVDIASTLIAMLRSQNIPARYAVGTITLTAAQINNWLGTGNVAVAAQLLRDQGIQDISNNTSSVSFEHAWVEVLIPFDQYRGLPTPTTVDCTVTATRCLWVPLDASFKQFSYNNYGLNPYSSITFDYTCYYSALVTNYTCKSDQPKNKPANPIQRLNKNPLTILEDYVTYWLQTNPIGGNNLNTLDDVANVGKIIPVNDGLLPASLPYATTGAIRTYNSVTDHDAAVASPTTASMPEAKKWAKTLTVTFNMTVYDNNTASSYPVSVSTSSSKTPILLAQLNTDRLTLHTVVSSTTNVPLLTLELGGNTIFNTTANFNIPNYTPQMTDPYSVILSIDGAPDYTGGSNEKPITATYNNLIVGGYYLIATGGSYSNWAQVHNAANQLIADNGNYPIVFNPNDTGSNGQACDFTSGLNCTPYVGGSWTGNNATLLASPTALDALTGGLLYVAATQYYANLVDDVIQANRLMHAVTSITGFVGMVSSVYEAEYLNNTAFSITPGGLLIDMKGIQYGGVYLIDDGTTTFNVGQYNLMGHIGSSLEHETWQALTGYDAVSTVRGIQMALANTTTSTSMIEASSLSGFQSYYSSFGFSSSLPPGFTAAPLTIFNNEPYLWTGKTVGSGFDTLLMSINSSSDPVYQEVQTYIYDPANQNYLYYWANCTNQLITNIHKNYPSGNVPQGTTCDGTTYAAGTQSTVLSAIQADWTVQIADFLNSVVTDQFTYFDAIHDFTFMSRQYRPYPNTATQYAASTIETIQTDLNNLPSGTTATYIMPSTTVVTNYNNFEVYILVKSISTSTILDYNTSFTIHNLGP